MSGAVVRRRPLTHRALLQVHDVGPKASGRWDIVGTAHRRQGGELATAPDTEDKVFTTVLIEPSHRRLADPPVPAATARLSEDGWSR